MNNPLTKTQKEEIDSLYSKYFKVNYSSHLFYTLKTGHFCKNYIPDSIYTCIIDPFFNNWQMASVLDNKCYYPMLFKNVELPEMTAYRLNGFWYNCRGKNIDINEAISLSMKEEECFIKKATDSWGGLGVYYFNSSDSSETDLMNILGNMPCDLVIQKAIKQSKVLAAINEDSVNTIRIISFLSKDGAVKIYSSILRMGIKGAKVDNASSGGISVGILADGKLKQVAFSNTGIKYLEHPTSHAKFDDYSIPNFEKMQDMVRSLHPQFPYFRLISWDIAVREDNEPVLIEANFCDGELDFHQLNNGPLFGNDTEQILSEVFIRRGDV